MCNINICLSSDDNYSKYLGVTVASILNNANKDDYIKIYVLDGGISENNKEKINSLFKTEKAEIHYIKIDESLFDNYKNIKTFDYISIATYYRLKLASMLPDVDKILYLDCDVIVNTSLSELFSGKYLDSDYIASGVLDIGKDVSTGYVNAGVLLMDLEKCRKEGIEEKFEEYTSKNAKDIKAGDQDIINNVLKGRISLMEDEWNVQSNDLFKCSVYTTTPKIIHYIGRKKPWLKKSYSFYKDLWLKNLQTTPWAIGEKEVKAQIRHSKSIFVQFLKKPLKIFTACFYKAIFSLYIKPKFQKRIAKVAKNKDIEIFILTYNRKEYLKYAIESALNQSIKNIKVTVLDNCSTDGTADLVRQYMNNKNLNYICNEKNVGILGNYLLARKYAKADYVLIFHDDDILHPQFAESILSVINEQDNVDLIYPLCSSFSDEKDIKFLDVKKLKYRVYKDCNDFAAHIFVNKCKEMPTFPSIVYRTETFKDVEMSDVIKDCETVLDIPYVVETLKNGCCIFVEESLYFYRNHQSQDSRVKSLAAKEAISRNLYFKEKLAVSLYSRLVYKIYSYYNLRKLYKFYGCKDNLSFKEWVRKAKEAGAVANTSLLSQMSNIVLKKALQKVKYKRVVTNLQENR